MAKALLFDIGDVVMKSNWAMLDELERVTARRIPGRGPLDPGGDPDWIPYLDGHLDAATYWDRKARGGGYADRYALWRDVCLLLDTAQFDPDAMALIDDARAAGVLVGVLSNDLVAIGGREWVDTRAELAGFDAFVDATEHGERKPAPGPYLAALEQFGLSPEEVVFLDDTPMCVEGARAVGMVGLHVDPTDRGFAFDRARQLVGLTPLSDAMRLVVAAEHARDGRDSDALCALMHPDVLIYENGRRVVSGLAEARRYTAARDDALGARVQIRTEPLAVTADTITLEWQERSVDADTPVDRRRGEVWTTRFGRIIELRAYGDRP